MSRSRFQPKLYYLYIFQQFQQSGAFDLTILDLIHRAKPVAASPKLGTMATAFALHLPRGETPVIAVQRHSIHSGKMFGVIDLFAIICMLLRLFAFVCRWLFNMIDCQRLSLVTPITVVFAFFSMIYCTILHL